MNRKQLCASASAKLGSANLGAIKATIGLDGFVDEICAVVDTRSDFQNYSEVATIADLGKKILAASGQSSNYELVVKQMKLGGNGPIMANALAYAGFGVTYIGAIGYPSVHPVFEDFGSRATLISVSDPGHTDAIEFSDGKLMIGKLTPLSDLTWDRLVERVGLAKLTAMLEGSQLIAMNNWTMIPRMSQMLVGLTEHVLPKLSKGVKRTFFVDLADPEKRTREDLLGILLHLGKMQPFVDVTLGLNLKESMQAADVLGIAQEADPEPHIEKTAAAMVAKLGIGCVVIHPRKGAAAADREGHSGSFAGPFVQQPLISTGAGDHFNAGFVLARVVGLSIPEALCVGVATSGYYVRTAKSPTQSELVGFVAELPDPQ